MCVKAPEEEIEDCGSTLHHILKPHAIPWFMIVFSFATTLSVASLSFAITLILTASRHLLNVRPNGLFVVVHMS